MPPCSPRWAGEAAKGLPSFMSLALLLESRVREGKGTFSSLGLAHSSISLADVITYVTPNPWALPAAASAVGVLMSYDNQQPFRVTAFPDEALQPLIAENTPLH